MNARRPSSRDLLNPEAVWRRLDRLKISQNQLAHRCGLSSGYMSQLVCGKRSPSSQVQKRIRKALGKPDLDDLFIARPIDS